MSLSPEFHVVKLRLAREKGHPVGDLGHGYDIVVPLDVDGVILPDLWRKHREACRVRRFRPNENDKHGLLARRPGGSWYFDYDRSDSGDDENAFRFDNERFTAGEYVSIREDDDILHTFQIVSVERL
jgi:hypothetical protein